RQGRAPRPGRERGRSAGALPPGPAGATGAGRSGGGDLGGAPAGGTAGLALGRPGAHLTFDGSQSVSRKGRSALHAPSQPSHRARRMPGTAASIRISSFSLMILPPPRTPALIMLAFQATARSAIETSAVSPDRLEMMIRVP